MMRNLFLLSGLLLTLFAPVYGLAESYESILTTVFKKNDGTSSTVRSLGDSGRGQLVLFWASWCVPCKEELATVARLKDQFNNWNITAINVDDSAGKLRAQEILKTLEWPFYSLNDESGAFFFQINSSGELPLALAFTPDGRLIKVIRELSPEIMKSLTEQSFTQSTLGAWTVSEEIHYRQRNLRSGHSDVGANLLGVQYTGRQWQVASSHYLIRQKVSPDGDWARFEDEIGPSYLQWQSGSKDHELRARIGDDTVEWGKGALLSARALPGTDTNATVLGGHFSAHTNSWSLSAVAGQVRQQLFGLQLDPTKDLTHKNPNEIAFGATGAYLYKFDDSQIKSSIGALSYRREKLDDGTSDYLTPHHDSRLNYSAGIDHPMGGAELTQTQYFIDQSKDPEWNHSQSTQVDAYLRPLTQSKFQIGATYLAHQDLIPRTFFPVLTEYPALPLTTDSLRSWRLAPRWDISGWQVDPQWIDEHSLDNSDKENQTTLGLSVLRPEKAFKTILVYQQHGSDPLNTDAEQFAGLLGSELSSVFSAQIEYKSYEAKDRGESGAADQSGRLFGAQLAMRIERLLRASEIGQMIFAVTRTEQDGYYMSTSGINNEHLTGYRLTWTRGPLEIRAAACQEPGGLVCSAGVCAQRPPLDGFSIDGQMRWNF